MFGSLHVLNIVSRFSRVVRYLDVSNLRHRGSFVPSSIRILASTICRQITQINMASFWG